MTNLLRSVPVRTVSVAAVAVAASLVLPFLVHLLPAVEGPPPGARFLPIFYGPLLAALFLGPVAALSAAALTPILNHALTGMPPMALAAEITVELLLFVTIVLLLRRRLPANPLVAPVAYLGVRLMIFLLLLPFPAGDSWQSLVGSLKVALPGIAALFVINLIVSAAVRERRQG